MRAIPIKKYDKLYEIANKRRENDEKFNNGLKKERWHQIIMTLDALRMGLVKPKNREITNFGDLFDPTVEWCWK